MEKHHFQWVSPRTTWPLSVAMFRYQKLPVPGMLSSPWLAEPEGETGLKPKRVRNKDTVSSRNRVCHGLPHKWPCWGYGPAVPAMAFPTVALSRWPYRCSPDRA